MTHHSTGTVAKLKSRGRIPVDALRVKQQQYIEAKYLPAEVLEDLWLARFGSEWVDGAEVQADDLFCAVAQRLITANILERQTLQNTLRSIYRLRQDTNRGWREE